LEAQSIAKKLYMLLGDKREEVVSGCIFLAISSPELQEYHHNKPDDISQ